VSNSILQTALDKVPQAAISVTYSNYKMTPRRLQKTKAGMANQIKVDSSNDIIVAMHDKSGLSLKEENGIEPEEDQWSIKVSSIASVDLAYVRKCLEDDGYAKLEAWFIETSKIPGSMGLHRLVISYAGKHLRYEQFSKF
jgi:hypothetical protein